MKDYVLWIDIEDYIREVVEFYKDKNITGVYGIPRGGLIFATILSNVMNIPLLLAPIKDCIIIDDICDSGESLLHYYKDSSGTKTNKYHITTMYYKDNELVKPEFYKYKKEENWIVFPWEVEKYVLYK